MVDYPSESNGQSFLFLSLHNADMSVPSLLQVDTNSTLRLIKPMTLHASAKEFVPSAAAKEFVPSAVS